MRVPQAGVTYHSPPERSPEATMNEKGVLGRLVPKADIVIANGLAAGPVVDHRHGPQVLPFPHVATGP